MCEFCENIIDSDTDIWKARNRGNDFIYKVDNEYGVYISTAEYCHPGYWETLNFALCVAES